MTKDTATSLSKSSSGNTRSRPRKEGGDMEMMMVRFTPGQLVWNLIKGWLGNTWCRCRERGGTGGI